MRETLRDSRLVEGTEQEMGFWLSIAETLLTDLRVVQWHFDGVEDVDLGVGICGTSHPLCFLLLRRADFFFSGLSCRRLLLPLLLAFSSSLCHLSRRIHCGLAWCFAKFRVRCVVRLDVLKELLAGLVHSVHLFVGGSAGAANSNQDLLGHLVRDLGQLALLAAHVLHDELVQVALHVGQSVLSLDNRSAFRVGADFDAEELEDGAFRDSQGASHVRQVRHVGLDSIQSTFLTQFHLRHLVSIVGVIILRRGYANVCHFRWLFKCWLMSL